MLLTAVAFIFLCGLNLYLGKWLYATFNLMVAFFFLKGNAIERWPRAARYLLIVAYAVVTVALFVSLVSDMKGTR